jgi:hypothetical protein
MDTTGQDLGTSLFLDCWSAVLDDLLLYLLWPGARVASRHGAYSAAGAKCQLPIVFRGLKCPGLFSYWFYWEAFPFQDAQGWSAVPVARPRPRQLPPNR